MIRGLSIIQSRLIIERRTADAVLAAEVRDFAPRLSLFEDPMIWLSVIRELRRWNLLHLLGYKIPLIPSIIFCDGKRYLWELVFD